MSAPCPDEHTSALASCQHPLLPRARCQTQLRGCRWNQEEQEMRQVFETLMAGSRSRAPEAVGKAGGSRSSRALLRARSRAVVTPDERQAMETLARQELVNASS